MVLDSNRPCLTKPFKIQTHPYYSRQTFNKPDKPILYLTKPYYTRQNHTLPDKTILYQTKPYYTGQNNTLPEKPYRKTQKKILDNPCITRQKHNIPDKTHYTSIPINTEYTTKFFPAKRQMVYKKSIVLFVLRYILASNQKAFLFNTMYQLCL